MTVPPPSLAPSAPRPCGGPDAAAIPAAEIGRRAPAGLGTRRRAAGDVGLYGCPIGRPYIDHSERW
jgi:hypothetical protein